MICSKCHTEMVASPYDAHLYSCPRCQTPVNHCIDPGSEEGLKWGFSRTHFDGYLWRYEDEISCPIIIAKPRRQGYTTKLFERILADHFFIRIWTPSIAMVELVDKSFPWFYQSVWVDELEEYADSMVLVPAWAIGWLIVYDLIGGEE